MATKPVVTLAIVAFGNAAACQCIFEVHITDIDAHSYRHKLPAKVLADQEKEKKGKYLEICHELRNGFTPLAYSVNWITGREAKGAEKRLATMLATR
ncbi:hypothetical protein ACHAXR_001259 [Thalassiosira sp. AJA248-18]